MKLASNGIDILVILAPFSAGNDMVNFECVLCKVQRFFTNETTAALHVVELRKQLYAIVRHRKPLWIYKAPLETSRRWFSYLPLRCMNPRCCPRAMLIPILLLLLTD